MRRISPTCAICILLAACAAPPLPISGAHLSAADAPPVLPAVPPTAVAPRKPAAATPPAKKQETYSVIVQDLPVQEVLFALARDARINLDIQPGIEGNVTLNALDQTLEQILARMEKQIDMRHEMEDGTLSVMPDTPYLKNYRIDYVDMSRESEGLISNMAQIGTTTIPGSSATVTTGNNSALTIRSVSSNRFWETLTQNIKDILRETDKILPEGSSETVVQQNNAVATSGTGMRAAPGGKKTAAKSGIENSPIPAVMQQGGTTVTQRSTFREAAAVIANPEGGIISVRATGKQHESVRKFIAQVMRSARRQALIEATVAEVRLNNDYQQGINWSRLMSGGTGFQLAQAVTPGMQTAGNSGFFVMNYTNPTSAVGNLSAQISLLESFGKVRVLSSPKLNVLNNQTAVLRVVDNLIYFTVKADTTTNQTSALTTYTTTPNTVPIGFTMSVTPQIGENGVVLLNLRPSISRLLGYINDPNPSLAEAGVVSQIPQTQTREMESVLRMNNGQTVVLGGLIQDESDRLTDAVPGLAAIPLLGNLFKNRNDSSQKTELVIFLKPTVEPEEPDEMEPDEDAAPVPPPLVGAGKE